MADDALRSGDAIARVQKLFLPPKKRTRAAVLSEQDTGKAKKERKECLRDALIAVYSGLDYNEDRERIFGWAACVVARLRARMPAGLKDDDESLGLTRCASQLAGLATRSCYREAELRQALIAVLRREMFAPAAEKLYGPPAKTINNWKQQIDKLELETEDAVKYVQNMTFPKPGPKPYLNDFEVSSIFTAACAFKRAGDGVSQRVLAGRVRNALKEGAEEYYAKGDIRTGDRLSNARCSKQWFKDNAKRVRDTVDLNERPVKTTKLSLGRASRNQQFLTAAMFALIAAWYEELFQQNILRTSRPLDCQIWNGDEISFDPQGKWEKVLKFRWDRDSSTLGTGEKAPFWVSVFFWTRADGEAFIPPFIIHQGKEGVHNEANWLCGGLDDDGNPQYVPPGWEVHQNQAGYNDHAGFMRIARHFVEHCGPVRPQFIFLDGHHSHWCPDALQYLLDNQVHVFFLRSQNSERDQPNDNGPNSSVKSIYMRVLGEVRAWLNPLGDVRSLPFTVPWFNFCFVQTWKQFRDVGHGVIRSAFRKCGLFPFNPRAENASTGSAASGALFEDGAANESVVFDPATKAGPVDVQIDVMQISATQANITSQHIMRSFVYKSIVEPRLKQSQQLRAEMDNYKRAKQNNVVVDNSSQNPSTVSGLAVRQAVIDLSREADRNREQKARDTVIRKEAAEAKRVEMRAKRDEAWMTVANAANLSSLTVAVLKLAAQRCKVDGVGKMKKGELIAALEPFKQSPAQLPDDNDGEVDDVGVDMGAEMQDDNELWDQLLG